jgi:hypothetical protein
MTASNSSGPRPVTCGGSVVVVVETRDLDATAAPIDEEAESTGDAQTVSGSLYTFGRLQGMETES